MAFGVLNLCLTFNKYYGGEPLKLGPPLPFDLWEQFLIFVIVFHNFINIVYSFLIIIEISASGFPSWPDVFVKRIILT